MHAAHARAANDRPYGYTSTNPNLRDAEASAPTAKKDAGRNFVRDANSGILKTLSHEITHFVRDYSPELYSKLEAFAMDVLAEEGRVDALIADKQARYERNHPGKTMSRELAREELTADACELMLRDSETVRRLVRENRTLAEKIADFVRDFVDRLRAVFGDSDRAETRAVMKHAEQMQKLFDDALAEAVEAHNEIAGNEKTTDEGGEQMSLREAEKIGYEKLIEQFYNNTLSRANPIFMGDFAEVTNPLFGSPAPLIISASDLNKSTRQNKGNSRSAHALSKTFVKTLPQKIKESSFGYNEDRNGVPSFTIVVYDQADNKLYAVGGELNAKYEGRIVNRVLSIFEIGAPEQFLLKDGKSLVTTNKEAVKNTLEKAGIQSPALQSILDRTRIVSQGDAEVKQQNSDRDVQQVDRDYLDAVKRGDLQTAQRMVDEAAKKAGYTIEAYHGTQAEFTVFDGGAFFTDDYFNADGYAGGERVIDAYLKLEHPLIIDAKGSKWDELNSKYGRSTREIVEKLDGRYDGVIFQNVADSWMDDADAGESTVYYIRDFNQAKSADLVTYDDAGDVIPLSERFNPENEDIRWSECEGDAVSDAELLAGIDAGSIAGETGKLLAEYQSVQKKLRNARRRLLNETRKLQGQNVEDETSISVRQFRQDAINLFSVPEGQRKELGTELREVGQRIASGEQVAYEEQHELFEKLLDAGRVAPDNGGEVGTERSADA